MSNILTTFWNRLIPYRWEETLTGQQFIMGRLWWREVRRQTFLHDIGRKINSPIVLFIDEAEKFLPKRGGQEMGFSDMPSSWNRACPPGFWKNNQSAQ